MTKLGKVLFTLVFLGLVVFGVSKWWNRLAPDNLPKGLRTEAKKSGSEVKLAETQSEVPRLVTPGAYTAKDNVVEIELSEYAGYAGLIAANGGLEPNDNSVFAQKYGFKLKIALSEEESWSALNSGKMAASATTTDVLAVYGKQFQVVVPAQIGFSRGADGIVVRSDIKRINDLKGKILVTAQFTEAEFFIRYLAQEAGLGVNMLDDLEGSADPQKLNLVFSEDAFAAGDLFLKEMTGGKIAGCVTWAPKTTEVVEQSGGKAHILATNRNLLIVADILIVNKGFAQANPDKVSGLVAGLLEGNRMVRDNQGAHLDLIGRSFKWDREQTIAELAKVHFSNLPENQAFFSGAIDAAGSFGGIYQSAIYAYGNQLIKDPVDASRFVDLQHLSKLESSGAFADQKVAIAPIKTTGAAPVETDPLLSKDIRFLFAPNSANLDLQNQENLKNLEAIKRLLSVSPGSTILLRGHVDNSLVEDFRKKGGDQFVRQMALKAVEFSKERAGEIKRLVIERHQIEPARLDTAGRGWDEPLGGDPEQNRRVEAQWFTLE
ncbi:MAG: OmpA family protein [Verrucomicrobiota bacterium]|nr:OmpA family protein [Verrucomicrobiota bacterium]